MSIGQIITKNFKETKLPSLEIELILAHVLKKSREFVLTHPEHELTQLQITNYKLRIAERAKGVPLAYITGHNEFYGLDFIVNRDVLVPRPETEMMVEEALRLTTRNSQLVTHAGIKSIIVDIGTGSGCIIISILKQLKNIQYPTSNIQFFGIDISEEALVVAKKNAKLHKVNQYIKFKQGNLLDPLINSSWKLKIKNLLKIALVPSSGRGKYCKLIILANLPYLTSAQIKSSSSIQKEPRLALVAGSDGLKYYRLLFKQINKLRVTSCELRDIKVLCEIDPSQTRKMASLIKKELPDAQFEIKKDLAGYNRLFVIWNLFGI